MMLAIVFSTFSAFAGEDVNQKVLNAFNAEFNSAKQVEWATGSNYYRASFVYNNKHVFAYYNMDGEFLGMTRYISSMDLPIGLQTSLKNDYADYWISDLLEVAKNGGTAYYVTLEDADTRLVLKSAGGNDWEVYSKTRKV